MPLGYQQGSGGYQEVDSSAHGRHEDIEMVSPFSKTQPLHEVILPQHSEMKKKSISVGFAVATFCGAVVAFSALVSFNRSGASPTLAAIRASENVVFDNFGRYILRNFDEAKPMSNFLSGLGGLWGVPMWAFYVNRGQGITSFGVQNKDGMIAKFQTAEKAYQLTPFIGFRTFVKGSRRGRKEGFSHMPFFPKGLASGEDSPTRNMMVGMNEMEIEEVSTDLGLKTSVLYFTVPEEDYPILVRRTTFTNIDTSSSLTLDVLDGLGRLTPAGVPNWNIDAMGRTSEAWMNVYNVGSRRNIHEPFFHVSQGMADTAEVQIIKEGHFSIAFIEDDSIGPQGTHESLPFIVDPNIVFGTDTTLTNPSGFFGPDAPDAPGISKLIQATTSRTPCAFAAAKLLIPAGASVTLTTLYGHAEDLDTFITKISPKVRKAGYIHKKRARASTIVDEITQKVSTSTSSSLLNAYIKQDFLDNTLRGGFPVALGDPTDPKIYHAFSRIHGDIERDYNYFQLEPTYFSQGPGNFRDVNQNRRLDVSLNPSVGDFNVRMFLSFVQSDGYNPLTVATTNFRVPLDVADDLVEALGIIEPPDKPTQNTVLMKFLLTKPFRIGQLFKDMKMLGVDFRVTREDFLKQTLELAVQEFAAQYAQNGFWADHWTYTMDLVDNYVSVFPDKEDTLLWDAKPIPFYLSPAVVKSRADRYSLVDNPNNRGHSTIRVYSAVSQWGEKDFPEARKNALLAIYGDPDYIADTAGAGGIWQRAQGNAVFAVSPISKLLILGSLKFSTLDPLGMGVEMEGGKPGWNDAMNGLPGLVGSGMSETYEMLRVVRYVKSAVLKYGRSIVVPSEFNDLINGLAAALTTYDTSAKDEQAELEYWDASNVAREQYRADTVGVFSGETVELTAEAVVALMLAFERKTEGGINRALATNNGLSPTYFYYECVDYGIITPEPPTDPTATPPPTKAFCKQFKQHGLPLFLEGPTRHMKIIQDQAKQLDVHRQTKASDLYDTKLQMYMLSDSLAEMGQEVGRMKAFAPGWLENQSVWLHMSYKFYLELLRAGLYTQFYDEIKTGLVPFMDPKVYGRSPLEAASFIVSSAFPDANLHGSSFLARLSGSTAELLSMWYIMLAGQKPFSLDENNELVLKLSPNLPGWLFNSDGSASFTFLGSVRVTYHNPSRADSWNLAPKSASLLYVDGTRVESADGIIRGNVAVDVRSAKVASIDVRL